MHAPEHFMTDTYTNYNKPVEIVPPNAGFSLRDAVPRWQNVRLTTTVDPFAIRGTRWPS